MKVAIIDMGSNSSRLNVFNVSTPESYEVIDFKRELTALVSYVNEEGALTPSGMQVACDSAAILAEFAGSRHEIDVWRVFATASLREISNSQEVVAAIKKAIGLEVEILTGEQEATFGFESLRRRFRVNDAVLADVGGGSTELVVVSEGKVKLLASLPLGCRKLSDSFLGSEQSNEQQIARMHVLVHEQLSRVVSEPVLGLPFFGIGGTAKALQRIIGSGEAQLPQDYMERAATLCPERLDTIVAGAVIFEELWNLFQPSKFVSSNANAREGYLICQVLPQISEPNR